MTGISAQYVDGLELRIKELTAYAKKLEQQIADDASVNAEIDKRLQAHNDVVAAKDAVIAELKEQAKSQDSTINQLVNIIQSHANYIIDLESQLDVAAEQLAESGEANESLERQLAAMTELEKNHIDQHKTLIAKLESVDVSMYQDGYELGYTGGVATAEARIAKLEAKLRTMSELDEQYLLIIDEQSERIAELERNLSDS